MKTRIQIVIECAYKYSKKRNPSKDLQYLSCRYQCIIKLSGTTYIFLLAHYVSLSRMRGVLRMLRAHAHPRMGFLEYLAVLAMRMAENAVTKIAH